MVGRTDGQRTTDAAHAAGVKAVDARETSNAIPLDIHHLWKPPVVRQFLEGNILHKESVIRQPSRFELAFDLAFAGKHTGYLSSLVRLD